MKTVLISSEVAPFSRTGILGDAVAGLARGLSLNGEEICVISPMYLTICDEDGRYSKDCSVSVSAGGREYPFDVYTTVIDSVHYVFMRNDELYGRRHIYGSGDFDYSDNDIRFGMFCLASLEYIRRCNMMPDIIHCHEWPTGLVPVYRNLFFDDIRSKIVFTALDISYQGIFGKFSLPALGLPWSVYNIEELEYYEGISLLKGGMVHSDYVTVPSPTYCEDIKAEENSQGLGLLMADMAHKLEGILYGINYDVFNPLNDKFIPHLYCAENLEAKRKNKAEFLKQAGLADEDRPLFIVETKFSERKGLELIAESAKELSEMNANFAFMGYGESYLCAKFKEIANLYDNIYTYIGISEMLVHLAYAAADFVLRPSLYEPSGNSHLKGMRYGALPVVSKTGGHLDSVKDVKDGGYGFFMEEYSRSELQKQVARAVDFFADKTILSECIQRVMQLDFSWRTASKKYIELYRRLLGGSYEN